MILPPRAPDILDLTERQSEPSRRSRSSSSSLCVSAPACQSKHSHRSDWHRPKCRFHWLKPLWQLIDEELHAVASKSLKTWNFPLQRLAWEQLEERLGRFSSTFRFCSGQLSRKYWIRQQIHLNHHRLDHSRSCSSLRHRMWPWTKMTSFSSKVAAGDQRQLVSSSLPPSVSEFSCMILSLLSLRIFAWREPFSCYQCMQFNTLTNDCIHSLCVYDTDR